MRSIYPKRASIFGALFFFALPVFAADNCLTRQKPDWQTVAYIYDGDSLRLADRRKIRLIGVNTPELAKDGHPDEPFARAAKKFIETTIRSANKQIGLIYGADPKDHYGRTLAHIVLPDKSNLTQQLLLNGLGSHIAISPNLKFNNCYSKAQQAARKRQQNLWRPANQAIIRLAQGKAVQGGFQHIQGKVSRIGKGRKNIWLNFGEQLAIRIARQDLHYFTEWRPASLLNQTIEASGWVYTVKGQQRMRIYHPSVIHVLD